MRRKIDSDYIFTHISCNPNKTNRSELVKYIDGVVWTPYPAFAMDWVKRELYSDSDKSRSTNEFVPGLVRYEVFPSLSEVILFINDNKSNLVLYSLEQDNITKDYILRCSRNREHELIG